MRLDRRLQIVLALLVSVAALMLGLGRREPRLPMLAIVAALVSLYGTDIRGWLRLNRWIANIAAVGCVAYCLSNFFQRGQQEMQLLSIADLLVPVQIGVPAKDVFSCRKCGWPSRISRSAPDS